MKLIQDDAGIDKIVQFSDRKRLTEQLDRTLPNGFLNMEIREARFHRSGSPIAFDLIVIILCAKTKWMPPAKPGEASMMEAEWFIFDPVSRKLGDTPFPIQQGMPYWIWPQFRTYRIFSSAAVYICSRLRCSLARNLRAAAMKPLNSG